MSFVRQFVVYGVAGAASRLAAIVLVPLYTRTLSIDDYGQLEVLLAIHALFVIVAGMQLESSIARDFFASAAVPGEAKSRAWWAVALTAATTAAISAVALVLGWLGWLPANFSALALTLLVALTLPAQLLGVQLVMLRFQGNAVLFSLASFADLALSALFSAWYIVGLGLGISGALLGLLSGKLICVGLVWGATFGRPPATRLRRGMVARMLGYGIPSLPAVLIGWVQNAGNRLLLALALTLTDVAIAGVAIKIAALYGFVVYSFRLAWEPFAMARLEQVDEDTDVYNRAFEWYVPVMFLACCITVVLAPFVGRILAPVSYSSGGWIAMLFVLGQFWVGVTNVLVIGIHRARRTAQLLPVFGYGALINLAVLFALAPLVGVAAAGVAFLAGSISSAVIARRFSNRHLGVPFNRRLTLWAIVATTVVALTWTAVWLHASSSSGPQLPPAALSAAMVMMAIALVALITQQSIDKGRRAAMWGVLRTTLRPGTKLP